LSPPALCAQLLQFLEEFKDKMVMRTTEVTREVDELVHEVKVCSPAFPPRPALSCRCGADGGAGAAQGTDVAIQNALNGFNMLSNTQFIENVRAPRAPRTPRAHPHSAI